MRLVFGVAVEGSGGRPGGGRRQLQRLALATLADRQGGVRIDVADEVEDVVEAPPMLGDGEVVSDRKVDGNLAAELHARSCPTERYAHCRRALRRGRLDQRSPRPEGSPTRRMSCAMARAMI